jgi:hypothetical protein
MSEEKERVLLERFRDVEAIIEVMKVAYDCGIRAFMLNTNERANEICDYMRSHPDEFNGVCFYPSMPYAHKYANAVAEKGIFGALKDIIIKDSSAGDIIGMLSRGGVSLFEKDMIKVMQLLVDIEMKIFRELDVKVVFLQNIVTDLLLGFGVKEVFVAFATYIEEKYGAKPGFVTMNMPRLVELLIDTGIEKPIVCSSINKAGYFMNPDSRAYEETLKNKNFRPIAMSILASGAVRPNAAVQYICSLPKIRGIVFGASSRQHIMETMQLIEKYSVAGRNN